MSKTLTLEGDVNAVDTLTRLTAQGSVSAPSLVVPAGKNKIKTLIFTGAADGLAAGQAVLFTRLGGNAVLNGEQQIMFGSESSQTVQAGADAAPSLGSHFILNDVDIDVRPSDTIDVAAEFAGADVGDATIAVTIIYE